MRQAVNRATGPDHQRVRYVLIGVTVAITLLVVVTAVGVGLATSATVYDDDVDYWIVPETDGASSPLIDTDGPSFGEAHTTAAELEEYSGVEYASPISTRVLTVEHADRSEYVLVIGAINSPGIGTIAGVDAETLPRTDPETTSGEVVLSETTGALLEAAQTDTVTIEGEEFSVTAVDEGSATGSTVPVVLMPLSDFQALTESGDVADQFVVGTNDPGIESELEGLYDQSTVQSRAELTASETVDADVPFALSLTAFVVSVVIGTLFVLTMMGLELVRERPQLRTLAAIGLSTGSQVRLIAVQTLLLTALAGLLGGVLGTLLTIGINELAAGWLTSGPIAVAHPALVAYGVVAALVIGVVSLPGLVIMVRRFTRGVPQ